MGNGEHGIDSVTYWSGTGCMDSVVRYKGMLGEEDGKCTEYRRRLAELDPMRRRRYVMS